MTQNITFSLTNEQYVEYINIFRDHGIGAALAYARLVSKKDYLNRDPLSEPRVNKRARK